MSSAVGRFGTKAISKRKVTRLGLKVAKPVLRAYLGKKAAKRFAKGLSKKLPILSAVVGVISGIQRVITDTNDPNRLFKATADVVSGITGSLPGVGIFVSLALDLCVFIADSLENQMDEEVVPTVPINIDVGGNSNYVLINNINGQSRLGNREINPAINM